MPVSAHRRYTGSAVSESIRGFILDPSYRIESGAPVVHLWGRLENGQTFLVRDGRLKPYFYVHSRDADRARQLGAKAVVESNRVTFDGQRVVRVEVATPSDTPPLRDRLQRADVPTFEADVRFAMRYLIDRRIRGALALSGSFSKGPGVDRLYRDPELQPADWTPSLEVLSLDLETDPEGRRILSAALYGCGAAEVFLLTPKGAPVPEAATPVATEGELIKRLCTRIRALDPDVLTGWNVTDFDFPVLLRRATELDVRLDLARGPGRVRRRPGRGRRVATQVLVPGRLVLDGLDLLRGAFVRMERYSLDFVAREVLGEGKSITGEDKAEQILDAFRHDRKRLVEYNLADARLVVEILQELKLVELAVERSLLTGLPADRVSSSVAAFDFLYLMELGRRGVVAPSVVPPSERPDATSGGYVLKPESGLYEQVLVLDFKSLYPSLIRTFHIDPLGYVEEPGKDDDLIVAPNGAAFRRGEGILGRLLAELFPRREEAAAAGDSTASFAIKILMNSFFGVLGTPVCRFYNPDVANAITSFGREMLLWSKRYIESQDLEVIYGDTDSLFVQTRAESGGSAWQLGRELVKDLNRRLAEHVKHRWGLDSRLEVELDALYLRLFLPPVRHGQGGARKRYAGLVDRGDGPEVRFTGLEVVRRDWTELARRAQRKLYERLFLDRPVEDYLRRLVADLRESRLDELLVYRKALRKDLGDYTTTTPPHVAAARKMSGTPGRLISYVITEAGPEPAAERRHSIDYEHYVVKQLRPVAEPVLELLGLDFAKVVGDDRQMDLF